jgi:magnesium transporter
MLDILSPLHLEDLQNIHHPSHFVKSDEYQIFIIRLFVLKDNSLEIKSHHFLIVKSKVYLFNNLVEVSLYEYLDKLVDESMHSIDTYFKYVEEMEEILYERKYTKHFIDTWFWIKKDLIRIERILNQAIDTIDDFLEFNSKSHIVYDIGFKDIEEHLNRINRLSILNLSKLDEIYNFYHTIKTEKLNKNIYFLTVISAIFLPLNLLVGFFGMNTGGMFFAQDIYGTTIVFTILVTITVLCTAVFLKMLSR